MSTRQAAVSAMEKKDEREKMELPESEENFSRKAREFQRRDMLPVKSHGTDRNIDQTTHVGVKRAEQYHKVDQETERGLVENRERGRGRGRGRGREGAGVRRGGREEEYEQGRKTESALLSDWLEQKLTVSATAGGGSNQTQQTSLSEEQELEEDYWAEVWAYEESLAMAQSERQWQKEEGERREREKWRRDGGERERKGDGGRGERGRRGDGERGERWRRNDGERGERGRRGDGERDEERRGDGERGERWRSDGERGERWRRSDGERGERWRRNNGDRGERGRRGDGERDEERRGDGERGERWRRSDGERGERGRRGDGERGRRGDGERGTRGDGERGEGGRRGDGERGEVWRRSDGERGERGRHNEDVERSGVGGVGRGRGLRHNLVDEVRHVDGGGRAMGHVVGRGREARHGVADDVHTVGRGRAGIHVTSTGRGRGRGKPTGDDSITREQTNQSEGQTPNNTSQAQERSDRRGQGGEASGEYNWNWVQRGVPLGAKKQLQ